MRPALLLLSGAAVGGDPRALLPAATAVELVHTFTLIHDDIMDRDTLRRGVPTVHVKYGLPLAILAGDTLFARAFQKLGEARADPARRDRAAAMLAKTCVEICEGQALDMAFEERARVTEAEYLRMVGLKTAALLRASAGLGALLAGAPPAAVARAESYGWNVGLAFQIQDDLLGLTATDERLGKSVGIDLQRKKKTLVAIHALARGFDPNRAGRRGVASALRALRDLGSIDYAARRARQFRDRAARSLAPLRESRAKRLLLQFADYTVDRAY
jgi:geranylgeranyl diphosphate synthase type I